MSPAVAASSTAELARILVRAAAQDQVDIYSVDLLSRVAGMSRRSFQYRCQAAGLVARDCVHFVQCLRAIHVANGKTWDPAALIPMPDPRTLRRMLCKGGLCVEACPTTIDFVAHQQFCTSPWFKELAIQELSRV